MKMMSVMHSVCEHFHTICSTNSLSATQDGSSDNDPDETMRDVDDNDGDGDGDGEAEAEADADGDLDAEGDAEGEGDGEGEGDEDDDGDSQSGGSQPSDNEDGPGEPNASATQDSTHPSSGIPGDNRGSIAPSHVRPEVLSATSYDIVPTIAAPHSTSINAVCATADTRWVFTGGSDGYIRKFNWVDSVNNKLALTVAQRHPFVDSVVKAGVLMSYWENFDVRPSQPSSHDSANSRVLSPVYSLACQSQALWLLSGTASGSIRLQSIRHEEGREAALLQKHTSAVSVLSLSSDERSLLSGSWDKTVLDWDLDTGKVKTTFASSASQISCIEPRPISNVPVPAESGEIVIPNGTFSSNNAAKPQVNGAQVEAHTQTPQDKVAVATPDSLFGGDEGDDDLFGDGSAGVMTNGADLPDAFGEDDDEMTSRVLVNEPPPGEAGDQAMPDAGRDIATLPPATTEDAESHKSTKALMNGIAPNKDEPPMTNGLPHADDVEKQGTADDNTQNADALPTSDSTFLATSIDGAIRVWDRRQPSPVARILPRNTPPWCLSACWSPDGNYIYAGRRNNTVEEYDLRKGLKAPERVFRFPNGSGSVTSVKAMPNGRHLIWYVVMTMIILS